MSNGVGGKQNKEGIGVPVSRIETIADQRINFERVGYLAEYDSEKIERYRLNDGDILFSHINSPIHIGKTAIFNCKKPLYHGINLLRIVLKRDVFVPELFNNYCKLVRAQGLFAMRAQHAVNQSSLNQKKLSAFEIPLPPLPEQKQIAATLDQLLARVEAIKTRLDAIPALLKRFRQSVLAAAVSGRLVEHSQEFSNTPFGDLIEEMKNGLSPKPNEIGLGHPILRISSVRPFVVDQTDVRYLECDEKTRRTYALETDDLLFTRYNGSLDFVGVCGRYNKQNHDTLLYPDKLIRVRTKLELLHPKYAEIFFSAPQTRKVVTDFIKSTSGQKGISGKDLKSVLVAFPVIEEQTQIVHRVEQLFAFADQIEQRLAAARGRVEHLTQSILARAFRGELTAQWRADHPELISGEHSAQALLDRIKAERAAAPVKKRSRKKRQ